MKFPASTYLRWFGAAIPPMLIVKAVATRRPGSTSRSTASRPKPLGCMPTCGCHARTAPHAFDVLARTARSKGGCPRDARFLEARLAKPLALRDGCGTPTERASAVRFFAADDTRLIGIGLGLGPRGVVLAHENRASLCNWLPYAVSCCFWLPLLAYDSRNSGRPGLAASSLDLDVVAAAGTLRRNGAERVVLAAPRSARCRPRRRGSRWPTSGGVFSLSGVLVRPAPRRPGSRTAPRTWCSCRGRGRRRLRRRCAESLRRIRVT